jgi:hypothetical protein
MGKPMILHNAAGLFTNAKGQTSTGNAVRKAAMGKMDSGAVITQLLLNL